MRLIARKLAQWYGRNARDLPWRKTRDPYAIWISEIMLQQTQVKTVIPYFERWMRIFPTIEAFAGAPLEIVLKDGKDQVTTGASATPGAAACQIMAQHGGSISRSLQTGVRFLALAATRRAPFAASPLINRRRFLTATLSEC